MNLPDLNFDDLKNIKLCVALHQDRKGDPIFPELLEKFKLYTMVFQSGLDFGKDHMEELKKVINNE